ncbi:hypothetical protein [Deinococcus planocerae]|uniref:hypothetical protein n=1 Tax=Deinococcus planocerae TaxID=1737569 RepID=UPI0011AEE620|nr:hypothetical protein [Deinococcus planocerae]
MPEMAELFYEVERLARLPLPPAEALKHLLKFRGGGDTPEDTRLLALPLNEAILDAQHWLNAVLIADPPPRLEVLWFGLFNTAEEDDTEPLNLYVGGASRWDDSEPELDYLPEGRHLSTDIFQRLAQTSGNDNDYEVGLLIAAILVRHALEALNPVALTQVASCAVYVGFDSGDYTHLGTLDQTGFTVLT